MRFNRWGDGADEGSIRTGPSRRQMEEDLRRAVLNTGGRAVAVKPAVLPPAPKPAMPGPQPGIRQVEAVEFEGAREPVLSAPPKLRLVDPAALKIETAYQRDLSHKSRKLIERIIARWDWAKFKPPICAETPAGLWIIDGQHTAIAAASHPEIDEIPVLIVRADQVERRAEAFVAHNRDRIAMTPAQILHGEAAAGNTAALDILDAVHRGGGSVPRLPVAKKMAKPGSISAIGEIRAVHATLGAKALERIVRIAALSGRMPASLTVLRAIKTVVTSDLAKLPDSKIAGALASFDDFEHAAQKRAGKTGGYRFAAGAELLVERLRRT